MGNRNSKGRAPEAKDGIGPIAGSKSMTRPGSIASEMPQTLRIRLLGGFSVSVGSRNISQDEWRSKKAAALVKLLALAPGHRTGAVDGSGASDDRPLVVLTSREREVATLVARGLTNRQVATELGISERTAGNHVARILRKLALRSRAQIASWVNERQLRTPHQN